MDISSVTCYRCGKCGKVWASQEDAERCCKKGTCERCGCELNHWYEHLCTQCTERQVWERPGNKFVAMSDWDDEVFYMDRYYQCPDDLLLSDDLGEFPEWGVFGTRMMSHLLTDESLEAWCDEYPDNLEVEASSIEEFEKFRSHFNEKWAPYVYVPDRSVSICRDDDPRLQKA